MKHLLVLATVCWLAAALFAADPAADLSPFKTAEERSAYLQIKRLAIENLGSRIGSELIISKDDIEALSADGVGSSDRIRRSAQLIGQKLQVLRAHEEGQMKTSEAGAFIKELIGDHSQFSGISEGASQFAELEQRQFQIENFLGQLGIMVRTRDAFWRNSVEARRDGDYWRLEAGMGDRLTLTRLFETTPLRGLRPHSDTVTASANEIFSVVATFKNGSWTLASGPDTARRFSIMGEKNEHLIYGNLY